MPPSNSPQKSDTEKLFIILILFVGFVLAFLISSNSQSPSVGSTATASRGGIPPELRNIHLDFSLLENILFKQLKVFGIIPVNPGQTGRDNPFAPY